MNGQDAEILPSPLLLQEMEEVCGRSQLAQASVLGQNRTSAYPSAPVSSHQGCCRRRPPAAAAPAESSTFAVAPAEPSTSVSVSSTCRSQRQRCRAPVPDSVAGRSDNPAPCFTGGSLRGRNNGFWSLIISRL
ncbi:hypothetical protein ILYODFUR_035938, partial [Ilyodon furcidens]